jgi:hypothetical protein
MRPVSDYLKKLLYQYDCLVVPALGGFLTHGVPATYHEATGQYLPPRRKVAFNEALRLDDGILLNYIMLHENCSREVALQAITDFVTTLKRQANTQGSFTIDGIGMFSVNTEQNLQFDPELRNNFLGNAYGFQPLTLTKQMVHPAVPVLDKAVEVRPLPVTALAVVQPEPASGSIAEVMPMPTMPRRTGTWQWAAAALLVGTLGLVSYLSVIAPNQSLQSSLNPANWLVAPVSLAAPTAQEDEKILLSSAKVTTRPDVAALRTSPAVAPTAVPVINGVSKPAVVVAPVTSVTKKAIPAPVVPPSATLRVSKRAVKPVVVAPAQPKAPFTVIAGSFANRSNAVRLQKMLVKAGYDEAYILPGRTKGLIKVAAVGFDNYEDAQYNLDSVNTLTGITPWILRTGR